MLIEDWEYLEDKLSMGHMALFLYRNFMKQDSSCGWIYLKYIRLYLIYNQKIICNNTTM